MFNVVCFLLYCMPVMPCLSEVLKNLFDLLYFILSLLMVGVCVCAPCLLCLPLLCHYRAISFRHHWLRARFAAAAAAVRVIIAMQTCEQQNRVVFEPSNLNIN